MIPASAVADIAHTIQLAVAPVFLLSGIGAFLNVLAGRLSRVIDRARAIVARPLAENDAIPPHARGELRLLDRRIALASGAIFLCTASAVLICFVVAVLFVANIAQLHVGRYVAIGFILAMLLLIAGLLLFLWEVSVAYRAIRVNEELIGPEPAKRR